MAGKRQACIAAGDNRQHPFCSATGRATGGWRAMWRLVPWDSWHPVLQRGVRRATAAAVSVAVYRQRQRKARAAARDPPRAPAGLGRARACKSAAHRTTTEHAAERFVGLFVSLPICAVLARTCFLHFPSCLYVCFARGPSPHDASYPLRKGNHFCGTRSRRRLRVSFVYSFGLSAPNYQWRCLDIECEVRDLA